MDRDQTVRNSNITITTSGSATPAITSLPLGDGLETQIFSDIKEKIEPYFAMMIGIYYASEEVIKRYITVRSKICECLISAAPAEEKISSILTLLLERRIDLKEVKDELTESDRDFVKMMQNHPLEMVNLVNNRKDRIVELSDVMDAVANVIRTEEEPKVQVSKIMKLMI